MRLIVPEQHVELRQVEPGYWAGDMVIDGKPMRLEAYDEVDGPQALIADLESLATNGEGLSVHTLPSGEVVYLVVIPTGD